MMYEHLTKSGELYFIEVLEQDEWRTIGDLDILRIHHTTLFTFFEIKNKKM